MKYYIHTDKTVEFYGTNPVLTEMELLDICNILSCIIDNPMDNPLDNPTDILATTEVNELHEQDPRNQSCTYCGSTMHKWENCNMANDELYDDANQNGYRKN